MQEGWLGFFIYLYYKSIMGIVYLFVMILGFAFAAIVSRHVSKGNDPSQIAFYRSVVTVLITFLLSYYAIFDNSFQVFLATLSYEYYIYTFLLGIFGFIPYLFLLKALKREKVSIINPITKTNLVITIIFSSLVFGLVISGLDAVFIIIVLLGMFLLLVDIRNIKHYLSMDRLALFYAICTLVGWGIFFSVFAHLVENVGNSIVVFLTEFGLMFTAFFYLLFYKKDLSFTGSKKDLYLTFLIGALIGLGAIGFSMSLNYYDIGTLSVFSNSDVLIVVLLGYLILGEKLSWQQWIGVIVILGGLIGLVV